MARRKTWKKGKVFTKNGKRVRYIYPNGKKKGRKLVSASSRAPRRGWIDSEGTRRYRRRR